MDENNRIDLNNPKTVNDLIREAFDYMPGDEYIEGEYQMRMDCEPIKEIGCHTVAEKLKNKLIEEHIVNQSKASLIEDVLIEILEGES